MLQSGFVCRSCRNQLRRQWREGLGSQTYLIRNQSNSVSATPALADRRRSEPSRGASARSKPNHDPDERSRDDGRKRELVRKVDPFPDKPSHGRRFWIDAKKEARRAEDEVEKTFYPREDQGFWDKFEETWHPGNDADLELGPMDGGIKTTREERERRGSSHRREQRRPASARQLDLGKDRPNDDQNPRPRLSQNPREGFLQAQNAFYEATTSSQRQKAFFRAQAAFRRTLRKPGLSRRSSSRDEIFAATRLNLQMSSMRTWNRLATVTKSQKLEETKKLFDDWKNRLNAAWDILQLGRVDTDLSGNDLEEFNFFVSSVDVLAMTHAWEAIPKDERAVAWPELISTALIFGPDKAPLVLEATYEAGLQPSYMIEDAMTFLIERASFLPDAERLPAQQNLCELLHFLLENSPKGIFRFRQNTLYHLLEGSTAGQVWKIISKLQEYGQPIHKNTLLQAANRLARDFKYKGRALQILHNLLEKKDIEINSPPAHALSTAILSLKEAGLSDAMSIPPAALFERILDMGLRPNIITYTTIIRNLCSNKELSTAWSVFEIMLDQNVEPDEHTYAILLNGAKLAHDFEAMTAIFNVAHSRGVIDVVIYNDLLHAVFSHGLREARVRRITPPRVLPTFRPLLEAYAKYFRLEPLQKFALSDLNGFLENRSGSTAGQWRSTSESSRFVSTIPTEEPGRRLEPRGDTLAIALAGYVKGFPDAYSIVAFYTRFRSLFKSGDPHAVMIVRETGTLIYDLVIKSIMEWNGMLRVSLDIVGEMIKDAAAAAATGTSASHPQTTTNKDVLAMGVGTASGDLAVDPVASPEVPIVDGEASSGYIAMDSKVSLENPAVDAEVSLRGLAVDAEASSEDSIEVVVPRHPAPSVHTWSILLNGFMYHRQFLQGERILSSMREHGIEPNVVTWNTLVAGYARQQITLKTVATLKRMDEAGLKIDDWTTRGFKYLRNTDRALTMMEEFMMKRQREELARLQEQPGGNETGASSLGYLDLESQLCDMECQVDDIAGEMDVAATDQPSLHDSTHWDEAAELDDGLPRFQEAHG